MAIDQTRLVLDETIRAEKVPNYIPVVDAVGENGWYGYLGDDGATYVTTQAVRGQLVCVVEPGTSTIGQLWCALSDADVNTVPGPFDLYFKRVDVYWPKIDPNTGKNTDINLITTDPDYVDPSLR
jgi:hypothetical protein